MTNLQILTHSLQQSTTMRVLILFLLIPFCMSCIWDRDTLAHDGKARMDAAKTIVGWFDRYPPAYYEMRLERVLKELETTPEILELYDDAAVALDRLHRSDEAISMMARKRTQIENQKITADKEHIWEHQYRYLANLGTFHAHRWIGTDLEERVNDLADLAEAERLIRAAIAHNPEAHFGREKYQLQAIRWLQMSTEEAAALIPLGFTPAHEERDGSLTTINTDDNKEAIQGLLGMMQLGAAWQSIDFNRALDALLAEEGRAAIAHAARRRTKELKSAGFQSLHPKLDRKFEYQSSQFISGADDQVQRAAKEWFRAARKAADARNEKRKTFMAEKFAQGLHPDTHSDFWNGWEEPPFPELYGESEDSPALSSYIVDLSQYWWLVALAGVIAVIAIVLILSALKKRSA